MLIFLRCYLSKVKICYRDIKLSGQRVPQYRRQKIDQAYPYARSNDRATTFVQRGKNPGWR